jgi:hypothetical protein
MASDFLTDLARGAAGEEIFAEWARGRWPDVEIRKTALDEDRRGIDFEALRRAGFQVKTDFRAADTGNVFVELYADVERRQLGWGLDCPADWIFVVVPGVGAILQIRPATVKAALAGWVGRFGTRDVGAGRGVPVPLAAFAARAEHAHWSPALWRWKLPTERLTYEPASRDRFVVTARLQLLARLPEYDADDVEPAMAS